MGNPAGDVLAGVGPRLRALRQARSATLAALATETGLTASTLSRLENGKLRPTLEQLLPWPGRMASRSTTSSRRRPPATRASTCDRCGDPGW